MNTRIISKTLVAALMASTALIASCKQEEEKASEDAKKAEQVAEPALADPGSVKNAMWNACFADLNADCVLKLADSTVAGMDAGIDRATAYAALGEAQARAGLKDASALSFRAAMSDARQVDNPPAQAPLFADMSIALARAGLSVESDMAAVLGDDAILKITGDETQQILRAKIGLAKAINGKIKESLDYLRQLSDATPALKSIKLKAICDVGVFVAGSKANEGLKIIQGASKDITSEQVEAVAGLAGQAKGPYAASAKSLLTQWQKILAGKTDESLEALLTTARVQRSLQQTDEAYESYKKAWDAARAGTRDGLRTRGDIVASVWALGKKDEAKQYAAQLAESAPQAADDVKAYAFFAASRAQAAVGAFDGAAKLAEAIPWQVADAGRPLRAVAMRNLTAAKAGAGDQQGALEVIATIKTQRERTQALSDVANTVASTARPKTDAARPKT